MSGMDAWGRSAALTFEVFPPRTETGMEQMCGAGGILDQLYSLRPGGICCTYGSGGADAGKNRQILSRVAADGKAAAMTWFSCAGNTRQSTRQQLQAYLACGVNHIAVLCAERPSGRMDSDFSGVWELTAFIRQEFADRFTIAVCADPEAGCAGTGERADIEGLKREQDNGADYIISRPGWDRDRFCSWLEEIRRAGVRMPVAAGIMPVTDLAATVSAALSRSGCAIPASLREIISENWIYPNPFVKDPFDAQVERKRADFRRAGMEYTCSQIREYHSCGVSGIHLLTGNSFADTAQIVRQSGWLGENC